MGIRGKIFRRKAELQPLAITQDDIVNLVKDELDKVGSNVPVDTIVGLIQLELGKLSVSVNVDTPSTEVKS